MSVFNELIINLNSFGFKNAIEELGKSYENVTTRVDTSNSVKMYQFFSGHPEEERAIFQIDIVEQNITLATNY